MKAVKGYLACFRSYAWNLKEKESLVVYSSIGTRTYDLHVFIGFVIAQLVCPLQRRPRPHFRSRLPWCSHHMNIIKDGPCV